MIAICEWIAFSSSNSFKAKNEQITPIATYNEIAENLIQMKHRKRKREQKMLFAIITQDTLGV